MPKDPAYASTIVKPPMRGVGTLCDLRQLSGGSTQRRRRATSRSNGTRRTDKAKEKTAKGIVDSMALPSKLRWLTGTCSKIFVYSRVAGLALPGAGHSSRVLKKATL